MEELKYVIHGRAHDWVISLGGQVIGHFGRAESAAAIARGLADEAAARGFPSFVVLAYEGREEVLRSPVSGLTLPPPQDAPAGLPSPELRPVPQLRSAAHPGSPLVERLIHADWSVSTKKRWQARARWDDGWLIEAVSPVDEPASFIAELILQARTRAVLAGFDFPIGVPSAYGERTGLSGFRDLLFAIGEGRWERFADIARLPGEVSIERPFFPAGVRDSPRREYLTDGLGVQREKLLRDCERATPLRRAASPLFWTLGAAQVGRGALSGWAEVIRPALLAGARLWPFDGPLGALAQSPGLCLAETYPAEAYSHAGVRFGPNESKTCQMARSRKGVQILTWAENASVRMMPVVEVLVRDGFGSDRSAEDRFDAFMGLAGMIEVASGRRPDGAPSDGELWEGWILGQARAG